MSDTTPEPRNVIVKRIVLEALDRPADERVVFVAARCGSDDSLRQEVLSILAIADRPFVPLDGGITVPLHAIANSGSDDSDFGDIQRFRVISKLGEGGFGDVWLADQTSPITRRVALKIIKPGMDSRAVIARFEQERQALALMDHPNIAKVLDAGTTSRGRPYFAMEYIKGEPITKYCDRQRLPVNQRLELFGQICDAVQHAHSKGVIHRDLKPSNILVAVAEGGRARPVIIDFGVAKAISARLAERSIFTERGQLIGTPEYMSPEQAEMSETNIDTRSDVYALGVVLYELLTGALPFETKTLRDAGYAAIQKMIREVDPPKPSTRLSTLGIGAAKAAEDRRSRLDELAAELRRELEWIPLKAMRKDRTERYRTAAELGDDIRNYLEGKPLIAGPEAVGYRMRKFLRRNRGVVAAATSLVLVVLLGLVATSVTASWALRERNRFLAANLNLEQALANELRARQELARTSETIRIAQGEAGEMLAYIERFISDSGPDSGRPLAAADALDRLATLYNKVIEGTFAPSPQSDARIRVALADAFREYGVLDRAKLLLAPLRHAVQQNAVDPSLSLRLQAEIWNAIGEVDQQSGERTEIVRGAFQHARQLWPPDPRLEPDRTRAKVAMNIAYVSIRTGTLAECEEAEALLLYVIDARRALRDPAWMQAKTYSNIGGLRLRQNKLQEAREAFAEALRLRRESYPENHLQIAEALNNLGNIARLEGRFDEARRLLSTTLDIRKALLPSTNERIANTLWVLGRLLFDMGDLDEAEGKVSESIWIRERLRLAGTLTSDGRRDLEAALELEANIHEFRGESKAAQECYEESLDRRIERVLSEGGHAGSPILTTLIGRRALLSNELSNARLWISCGLAAARNMDDDKSRRSAADGAIHISAALRKEGYLMESATACQVALDMICKDASATALRGRAYTELGLSYAELNMWGLADEALNSAMTCIPTTNTMSMAVARARILIERADARAHLGDLAGCGRFAEQATEQLSSCPGKIAGSALPAASYEKLKKALSGY